MDKNKEQEIIKKVIAGDKDGFRELIDANSTNIYALIRRMVVNREDAQELTQDVFVKAFFSLKQYRGDSSFSTWLYRIAYNLTISNLRKKRIFVSKDDMENTLASIEDESQEEIIFKQGLEEKQKMLDDAIDALPPDERFMMISFYRQDKSLQELSQISGMSLSNVKVRLFRTRKKITKMIEDTLLNQQISI